VACGGVFDCTANAPARSVFQRILSVSFSEYVARSGGRVRRMDALVLRGRICRRERFSPGPQSAPGSQREAVVITRPNLLSGEDLPPEPRQKRSLEKRARLDAAALVLFGEKGYEGASVGEIAGKAKLALGSFYQHYHSKRQLLLVLMDELLGKLSQLSFRPKAPMDVRAAVHDLLSGAFSHDLRYLGAYRAWQEAVLSDPELAHKQEEIHAWTTKRVMAVFQFLQQLPRARQGVDVPGLARAMDSFFWSLLARAVLMPKAELDGWIDSSTHLIYHAMFTDPPKTQGQ
jgi:AcrR family transcriptional regulator